MREVTSLTACKPSGPTQANDDRGVTRGGEVPPGAVGGDAVQGRDEIRGREQDTDALV